MAKKTLALNIGARNVVLAEYEGGPGALTLVNYGKAALAAALDESNADTVLTAAVMDIMRETGIKPGPVALSISGQMVFPRFAVIPYAGDEEKFEQLVRYEIEQNIPFPIDEMVCDHHVLGDTEGGDKAVLVVAAKTEQVEAITAAVAGIGFYPERVSVAPIAATGLMLSGGQDDGSCKVLLDIGARTTSLVVVEGDRIYNRSIPVAGNAITKEIASALGCSQDEAEKIKLEKGYVALGGVVEDEDEVGDRVSKACRAVLTRLQAEISRSINFYRSQQGGSAPTALYMTGGTALLPQLDAFFAQNLNIAVEYFNPLATVSAAPSLDEEKLGDDAAFLAAVTGAAAESAGDSRFSINLMPPSLLAIRAAKARIPFVAAGAVMLVVALVLGLVAVKHDIRVAEDEIAAVEGRSRELQRFDKLIKAARADEQEAVASADAMKATLLTRGKAARRFDAVRKAIESRPLWIESWDGDKITVRGWKNEIEARVKENRTVSEIVAEDLKHNVDVIVPESVKITEMTTLGKGGNIEQFTVEVKFK